MKRHILLSEDFLVMTSPNISCFIKIDVLVEPFRVKRALPLRNLRFGLFSLLVKSPKEIKILPSDTHGYGCRPTLNLPLPSGFMSQGIC